LNTCVWGGAAETLRSAGHDVRWMGDAEPDPGDDAILQPPMAKKKTKAEETAELVAAAVGAGRNLHLPSVVFADPNRPKTCLEVDFPILPIQPDRPDRGQRRQAHRRGASHDRLSLGQQGQED
jgi:hypothetical protein